MNEPENPYLDEQEPHTDPVISGVPAASPQIAKLVLALSKAQGDFVPAKKQSDNPYYESKYADLAAVWEVCRKPLSKNELAVIQLPKVTVEDCKVTVTTILAHSSGEWISSELSAIAMKKIKGQPPVKDAGPQSIASVITYLRRYGLQSIVGIAAEDDDDAESAVDHGERRVEAIEQASRASEFEILTPEQLTAVRDIAYKAGADLNEVKASLLTIEHMAKGQTDPHLRQNGIDTALKDLKGRLQKRYDERKAKRANDIAAKKAAKEEPPQPAWAALGYASEEQYLAENPWAGEQPPAEQERR